MREGLSLGHLNSVYARIAHAYDFRHGLLTLKSDQVGRRLVVRNAVREGDRVLDCGGGTGSTAILAARKVGPEGRVTLFDLSEAMLGVAERRVRREGLQDRVDFRAGDMARLPFEDESFDAVLSTYSLCPLYDPSAGAVELYRVVKPAGRIGAAHSTEPKHAAVRLVAEWVEAVSWRFPSLSMGCRPVQVLPALEKAGGKVVFERRIGVPLWPFIVFVVEKPVRVG